MDSFSAPGEVLSYTAPVGGVVSGSAYLIGTLVVIAAADADVGDKFEGVVMGVFDVPKLEGETWTEGEKIYFDSAASPDPVFTDQSGGQLCGVAASGYPQKLEIFTSAPGSGLAISRNTITVVDFNDVVDTTLTVILDGDGTVLLEGSGHDFQATGSNGATATDIATAIAALTGLSATANGAVVTVQSAWGRVRLDGATR